MEEKEQELIRLQKYMAECGVASRRKAEQMMLARRVKVNGIIIDELGFKIDPKQVTVTVDDEPISPEKEKCYLMLNKPMGYITSACDQFDRPTVLDLVKDQIKERVFPVGRLDYETEGLLLLTNDGDLAFHLTHPTQHVSKTYLVIIKGDVKPNAILQLRRGVKIGDYVTKPAEVEIVDKAKKGFTAIEVTISEGKNRQVRRMFEAVGYDIYYLQRTAVGIVSLGNLAVGKFRHLTAHEINCLRHL